MSRSSSSIDDLLTALAILVADVAPVGAALLSTPLLAHLCTSRCESESLFFVRSTFQFFQPSFRWLVTWTVSQPPSVWFKNRCDVAPEFYSQSTHFSPPSPSPAQLTHTLSVIQSDILNSEPLACYRWDEHMSSLMDPHLPRFVLLFCTSLLVTAHLARSISILSHGSIASPMISVSENGLKWTVLQLYLASYILLSLMLVMAIAVQNFSLAFPLCVCLTAAAAVLALAVRPLSYSGGTHGDVSTRYDLARWTSRVTGTNREEQEGQKEQEEQEGQKITGKRRSVNISSAFLKIVLYVMWVILSPAAFALLSIIVPSAWHVLEQLFNLDLALYLTLESLSERPLMLIVLLCVPYSLSICALRVISVFNT